MGLFGKTPAPQIHEVWEGGVRTQVDREYAELGKREGWLRFCGYHRRAPAGGVGEGTIVYRYEPVK